METKCTRYERLRIGCVALLIVSMSILNVGVVEVFAQAAESAEQDKAVSKVEQSETVQKTDAEAKAESVSKSDEAGDVNAEKTTAKTAKSEVDNGPRTEKTSSSNSVLYGAIGIGAAAALAVGLGGSGGSGSSSSTPAEPVQEPVGADLQGSSWHGRLLLINGEREQVTAVVTQVGRKVEIITTTTQRYAKKFNGTIRESGHMTMKDQTTGETWTTFEGPARWNRIDLYDYVNDFRDLDNLYLTRESRN